MVLALLAPCQLCGRAFLIVGVSPVSKTWTAPQRRTPFWCQCIFLTSCTGPKTGAESIGTNGASTLWDALLELGCRRPETRAPVPPEGA
ncbi:hypothetical protein SBV1_610001 [Verrucomicrobia bacterium]|nr:hypothetical protein SBV1_610001 [Verrucomicrobiota bacterium]